MRYTLYLKMLDRSDLPTQVFSSVDNADDAALKIKAACTKEERRSLRCLSWADDDGMCITDSEIPKAYRDQHPLDP